MSRDNTKKSTFVLSSLERLDMTTFERIKNLADTQKISLKELAIMLGFSENYFYNMKNAKSSPSSEILTKVADHFGVTVDYLLGREEIKGEVLNKDEKDMLLAFRLESNNMSEEKRKAFKKSLKTLMKSAREIAEDDSFWED